MHEGRWLVLLRFDMRKYVQLGCYYVDIPTGLGYSNSDLPLELIEEDDQKFWCNEQCRGAEIDNVFFKAPWGLPRRLKFCDGTVWSGQGSGGLVLAVDRSMRALPCIAAVRLRCVYA